MTKKKCHQVPYTSSRSHPTSGSDRSFLYHTFRFDVKAWCATDWYQLYQLAGCIALFSKQGVRKLNSFSFLQVTSAALGLMACWYLSKNSQHLSPTRKNIEAGCATLGRLIVSKGRSFLSASLSIKDTSAGDEADGYDSNIIPVG